jgi:hypothetical protein
MLSLDAKHPTLPFVATGSQELHRHGSPHDSRQPKKGASNRKWLNQRLLFISHLLRKVYRTTYGRPGLFQVIDSSVNSINMGPSSKSLTRLSDIDTGTGNGGFREPTRFVGAHLTKGRPALLV